MSDQTMIEHVSSKRQAETQPHSEPQAKRLALNEVYTTLSHQIFVDPNETDIRAIVNGLFKSKLTHIAVEQDGNCFFNCIGLAFRKDTAMLRRIVAQSLSTDALLTLSSICEDVSVGEKYADSNVVKLLHNTKLPDLCAHSFPSVRDQLMRQYRELIVQNWTHADPYAIATVASAMETVRNNYFM